MKANFIFCRTMLLLSLIFILGACNDEFLPEDSRTENYGTTRSEVSEIWDGTVAENFAGGDGTESNPYQIANGEQLAKLAQDVDSGNEYVGTYFVLTADIVLNDISNWESWDETTVPVNTWKPIGNYNNEFSGTLDGKGHSVSGIYINGNYKCYALVGRLTRHGTIKNIGTEKSFIKGYELTGGICGYNEGRVSNCYNTSKIIGSISVGGVCGFSYITINCHNTGNVKGIETGNEKFKFIGGVCGYNSTTITNCYNTGNVTGYIKVGGVCGGAKYEMSNCYNTGCIIGNSDVAGISGSYNGTLTNCFNTGSVTGTENSVNIGGICGNNQAGTISNSYNIGKVSGQVKVGSVCGINPEWANIINCYYMEDTASSGIGEGIGEATSKTAEQFTSGEVSYLLQDEQAELIWGQTIGTEEYPVLGGKKVYNNNGTYSNIALEGDYYMISTADELRLFASIVNSGNTNIKAKLTADIVLNNTKDWESWDENTEGLNIWTPIGSYENQFTGILDGQGHSVSGIYVNSNEHYQGFVGYLGVNGIIQNIGVKESYVKGVWSTGGVCGQNDGLMINCYNSGNVTGSYYVGGVCGRSTGTDNEYSFLTNCYNTGKVTGHESVGGVCGLNTSYGPISNCYNIGNVTGEFKFGSVCGHNDHTVTNCYYLEGTTDGIGIDFSGTGKVFAKSAEQFASGEVAYLLGKGWGQTIGTDDLPVLDAEGLKQIYAVTLYNGTNEADNRYLNSNGTFPTLTGNAIAIVDAGSPFATGNKNIVVKDGDTYTCANLVLYDRESFYTPVEFTAGNATYSRYPWVWADGENGWETICLPFSGTLYADEQPAQPVDLDTNSGDYWLRNFTDFEAPNTLKFSSPQTAEGNMIEAGRPYLIALPGRAFPSNNMQEKYITVRGMNVKVIQNARPTEHYPFIFTGTFARETGQSASYILNSENDYMFGEGNLFILSGASTLYPFRCRIDVTGFNVGRALSRSASSLPQVLRIGQ